MNPPSLDFRNTNALWGSVLAETLVRCGVTQAVVSPGSRSTPLTMALARHAAIEAVPVLDERSAAFFALGLAKRLRRPVVLVCTSGTAGANYYPAIIEAHESRVPLLIVTADRPPEMRDCASGQTIDQQKLFGGYTVAYHELAVPEPRLDVLGYLRQMLAWAVGRAADGPVHLNAPFRDPLPPTPDGSCAALESTWPPDFFDHLEPRDLTPTRIEFRQKKTTTRGLIVAGPASPADPAGYASKIASLSRELGWPILADALSPLRHHGGEVVTCYDAILRNDVLARDLTPRTVLCLEGWPTSKVLRSWLERSGSEVVLVAPGGANRDALHGRTRHLAGFADQVVAEGAAPADASYRHAWHRAESAARLFFDQALASEDRLFEPKAAWLLASHLPAGTPLFVSSSMPVRDLEYLWPATDRGHRICFNRGANGIDGTLSTALGIAHGGAPTVLLTGDLALLHDANGFLTVPRLRGSLTIVLIDNNGGGIFEHLPVAQFDPPFDVFWATPQQVDFEKLCAAHGVGHVAVNDWRHFADLISTLPAQGVRVLHVRTDRKRDAADRKALFAAAAKAASA